MKQPSSTVAVGCIPILGSGSINGKFSLLIRYGRSTSSSLIPRGFALQISTSYLRITFQNENHASCSIAVTHGLIQALPGIGHDLDGKVSSLHVHGPMTQTLSLRATSKRRYKAERQSPPQCAMVVSKALQFLGANSDLFVPVEPRECLRRHHYGMKTLISRYLMLKNLFILLI